MDTARVTKTYWKIVDARAAAKAAFDKSEAKVAFDAADKKFAEQQQTLEGAMLGFLNDTNQDKSANEFGGFKRRLDLKPSAEDWAVVYNWIAETGAWELLNKRITKTFVEKYAEDHEGALPPGVKVYREYILSVTRAA
jgi:hypothetical protein